MEHQRYYWWKDAKIYELYIDKFAGDFQGLTSRLDYMTALGINCLHMLPFYPSPMVDDGYDVMDYRSVRPELGTLGDFTECLAEAHHRGIRVIIDLVLNHVSSKHPWFIEARASRDNSKRDFFLWDKEGRRFQDSINAFPDFKPSNWIRNDATGDYYYATFYPEQPDLNWDNPKVMEEMLAIMDFWIARGVDGFRLDAAKHLIKRDSTRSEGLPETHQVLKTIRKHLDLTHPDVILLAEAHQLPAITKTYFGSGDECHMAYHFPLAEQFWLALKRHDLHLVDAMVEESFDIPYNSQWATFLRSHDEISLATLPLPERSELNDFFDPDHCYLFRNFKLDELASVRIATIYQNAPERIAEAFALLYKTPGAPIMYYGDEIGMKNLPLEAGIVDTRKYVRGAFDWEEATKQVANPDSLWSDVASLIKTRTAESLPAVTKEPAWQSAETGVVSTEMNMN
ncbi:MAG: hypothetical protein A2942_04855 [Candidatus Lloydbacteria bacterium RIFCSPLOWO2_01_FULL_50_20]|uniref:Alpha-amylase n=1 Tax=Candidatus Lloydbacteria bacterium RIFCSPLOWO2_01_FULL_50_20 TaxID=1798665 RepID=A0A1G2DDJ0_9BACT|nr:MAG: hypothetical protein A3C13_02335 [Candidatus Lloydbacteria bacterium RIFCSPHIGHO2_02_FULL_50_11]OGZ11699.1 MAG: hypothetical protein A2942_04855 [Candidatus Lloydbacteria bacterium RIFCSPLOWO2_01_FULL_50_20]